MKQRRTLACRSFVVLAAGFIFLVFSNNAQPAELSGKSLATADDQKARTALDEYVAAPDTNYTYTLLKTVKGPGLTAYILDMTSQAWLTTNEVDRPLWKHWLTIVKPDKTAQSTALLFVGGGGNGGAPPKGPDSQLARIAVATRSVVAEIKMIPNQPLTFAGETEGRKEDSLIAYTWDKFLRTGNSKWPARLPMTKAVVRGMDTISSFCATAEGGNAKVEQFVIAGGSKRGWTTWTTAAVDKRVVAIIPVVIDVLNIGPSMLHHYGAYGFWAPAIDDYSAFKIMDWNGTPEFRDLMRIVEPYEYRERLTMPKFIVNACGDQFFLPDSSQFYFDDLPGVKYLRYIPNADHSLKGTDAYESLAAFYSAILSKARLPQFSWKLERDGAIRVTAQDKPSAVKLWHATNPEARDFRLDTLGAKWESARLQEEAQGVYLAQVSKPAKGWTAFMVELSFPSGTEAGDFKFTTPVRVIPEVLPYKFTSKGRPE